jgi:hypothetical protein
VGIFSFLTGDKAEKDASTAEADGRAVTAAAPDSMDTSALTAPPPAPAGDQPSVGPADPAQVAALQAPIIEAMKTVFDPEIPVDIYELGLIYDIIVDAER